MRRFIAIAESVPARHTDPWEAFETFVREIIDSDVHSLTVRLAGTFAPTPELRGLAAQASALAARILDHAKTTGAVRPDVDTNDLLMIFDQITAIRLNDPDRTAALRHRYLTPLLDALRVGTPARPLPGPPPSDEEIGARWRQHTGPSPSPRSRSRR